jgi:hypothetical protein
MKQKLLRTKGYLNKFLIMLGACMTHLLIAVRKSSWSKPKVGCGIETVNGKSNKMTLLTTIEYFPWRW